MASEPTPTLLELLERAADVIKALTMNTRAWEAGEPLTNALRAAAARLREEMERATRGGDDWFLAFRAIDRINGGGPLARAGSEATEQPKTQTPAPPHERR